jgi:hypothetical protein
MIMPGMGSRGRRAVKALRRVLATICDTFASSLLQRINSPLRS